MRWAFTACDQQLASRLAAELNVPPLMARLLAQRGIHTPEEAARFLTPSLSHLHSPYAMLGMKAAVERLQRAVAAAEPALIYGDYDVDGTLAVVILKTAIELCGGVAQFHVPHRIREGYGMRDEVIADAAARGVRLIISVDTGIRAFSAAATARDLGLDLIVTDHHLTQDGKVPDALAVLNPNQPGCDYPCKSLCGAGVAFKLAQALLEATGRKRLVPSFLKMVAIATIADAVPLTGENRVFAKLGLEGLRHPVNPGLKALLDVAALGAVPGGEPGESRRKAVSASDVGFRIAPRLNAAGRMDVACDVIELFTVKDEIRAREIAAKLNQLNADRQLEEGRIVREIQERLDADAEARAPLCLVLDGEGWHRGVIGIVATRVVERYGRPALVISRDAASGEAHGSGRSIPGFHLLDALEAESCRGLFIRFGGHAHAVGFALPCERIAGLRSALEAYARVHLTAADLVPSTRVDTEIELSEITPDFYDSLRQLEPFGQQNPQPVFAARGVALRFPPRVLKEKHIKLRLGSRNANSPGFDALGWRMAERMAGEPWAPGDRLDVAFCIEENSNPEFGGMQLVLRDYVKAAPVEAAPAVASVASI
jgi:single-stranded-DNA-specific exonuclease